MGNGRGEPDVIAREATRPRRRRRVLVGGVVFVLLTLLGVAGCTILGDDFKPVITTPEMVAEGLVSRFTRFQGDRIHYVSAGRHGAPAVLFIHGSPGTWEAWRGYLRDEALRERAYLIAPDRLGFGGSERGHAVASMAEQAAAMAAVLEAERTGPAVVVGHSLGGPVAARLAVDRPDLVAGLVLVAPSIDPDVEHHRWFNVAGSMSVVQWFLPVDWITSNREIWPLRKQLLALEPGLARVRVPVVVIQGDQDKLVSPKNADYAEQAFTTARLDVRRIPGATHFVVWRDPQVVRSAILDVLDRIAGTTLRPISHP